MRRTFTLISFFSLVAFINSISAQTIWDGPVITVVKEVGADWTLEENQDRVTDNVWFTRADTKAIFNIAQESSYTNDVSPVDTEWAFGTTDSIDNVTFEPWEIAVNSSPLNMVDKDMVVHLITDDIYINIKFLEWTGGGAAGYVYERSTEVISSNNDIDSNIDVVLFPNPSPEFVQVKGLTKPMDALIFDANGKRVYSGVLTNTETINISKWATGSYFLQLENKQVLKFQKQ